jgi:uncharacterized protein (DUF697 family)
MMRLQQIFAYSSLIILGMMAITNEKLRNTLESLGNIGYILFAIMVYATTFYLMSVIQKYFKDKGVSTSEGKLITFILLIVLGTLFYFIV